MLIARKPSLILPGKSARDDIEDLKLASTVRERLKIARSADKAGLSYDQVRNRVAKGLNGHSWYTTDVRLHYFYRARPNNGDERYENLSQIWHPPEPTGRWGRFNRPDNTVLYTCGSAIDAIGEVGFEFSKLYTLCLIDVKEPKFNSGIGYVFLGLSKSDSNLIRYWKDRLDITGQADLNRHVSRPTLKRSWDLVDDYVTSLATRPCEAGQEQQMYMPSNVVADALWNIPVLGGIAYPSVSTAYGSTNVCFSTDCANEKLKVVRAWEVRPVPFPTSESCHISLNTGTLRLNSYWELERLATEFTPDGAIIWKKIDPSSAKKELEEHTFSDT